MDSLSEVSDIEVYTGGDAYGMTQEEPIEACNPSHKFVDRDADALAEIVRLVMTMDDFDVIVIRKVGH